MIISKQETLADKIAGVLSTAPSNFDLDDEIDEDTRAKVTSENDFEEHVDQSSKFRKQNVDLLADVDERYAGKKGSRKNLSSPVSSSDDDFDSETELEAPLQGSDEDEANSDSEEQSGDGEDSEELTESDGGSDDAHENGDYDISEPSMSSNFKHMEHDNVISQKKKGTCVRNQMSIWENLLEMRIQMQKCLLAANKLPLGSKREEMKMDSGSEFTDKVFQTRDSLAKLLDKLLDLQKFCWSKYPETKSLKKIGNTSEDPDDEEIPSDTDEEDVAENEDSDEDEVPSKRRKIADFESELSKQHEMYKKYRTSVIQKWHDKTNISGMKNNVTSYSVINTIEHALADKTKLVKRTQLKKSDYDILGEDKSDQNPTKSTENTSGEYYPEIFDDTDFYHQLLRELIEVKSADITDPVHLGRQWIQLQSLRSKMKRKIDTRATKGRKIRYAVHTKLVNFMAPMDDNLWLEESKNELFSSLFGKNSLADVS
ncbi:unnamed protein product [Phaedon cochleariae]|uniref:Protein AATF n=1 Tax=Phaedon cochleariae TaxID=80249 RepID=A0A9P0DJC4_PHACE|nr:unnamed protein product [Phaedon cochleariae]